GWGRCGGMGGDRFRPTGERCAIVGFELLGAMDGRSVLQDAEASVLTFVDFVDAKKAAHRLRTRLAGRVEPDHGQSQRHRECRFERVTQEDKRRGGQCESNDLEKLRVLIKVKADMTGEQ